MAAAIVIAAAGVATIATLPAPARPTQDGLPGKIELVGSNALDSRGLNSTMAVGPDRVYAGSYTDTGHEDAGVKILAIGDPERPRPVGAIPAEPGLAPIELRIWRRERLLIVLNDRCRPPACESLGTTQPDLRIYDIRGARAERPKLLLREPITPDPHEFYLWQDPRRPDRALAYVTTPKGTGHNLTAFDLSGARDGGIERLATWDLPAEADGSFGVHSVSLSPNGRRAYVSAYDLGYVILSTAPLARGEPGADFRQLTAFEDRVTYGRVNAHSFVKVPGDGRFALTTDEIFGCPWASMNVVDVGDPRHPEVVGNATVPPYSDPEDCAAASTFDPITGAPIESFSPHDPTATCDLAIVSWYGAGVQAFSLGDLHDPRRVAEFRPAPLSAVTAEHPSLRGVVMHSYPIVQEGLIYVLDIRNGLYVLRYQGPHERQVTKTRFVEGNSNIGAPSCPRG